MRRDMDLIRYILTATENAEGVLTLDELTTPDHNVHEVAFHVDLMKAHGLVDGNVIWADAGSYVKGHVDALTWDGYDYLEAIRDDTVWSKTKDAIAKTVGSTTIDVIKQVAVKVSLGAIIAVL